MVIGTYAHYWLNCLHHWLRHIFTLCFLQEASARFMPTTSWFSASKKDNELNLELLNTKMHMIKPLTTNYTC